MNRAVQGFTNLTLEEIAELGEQQIAMYNETGTVDRSTFIGEVIGLHNALGTRMVKLQLMTSDLKEAAPVQFADDDPDL
ncbi:hypothetical protein D3C71_2108200 [compost metagenome]